MEQMTVSFDKEKITIELPLDILVNSQKYRDDVCYEIYDSKKMAEWFSERILTHTRIIGLEETGGSDFTFLIDELFDKAYENGATWLEDVSDEPE